MNAENHPKKNVLFIASSVALSTVSLACAPTLPPSQQLRSEFRAVGISENARQATTPESVKVYYKSSPDGFSLSDNELTVSEGYKHVILGELRVRVNVAVNTETDVEYETIECYRAKDRPNQEHVLAQLKTEAAKRGANAVVYAYSELSQSPTRKECELHSTANDFGGGWAVQLVGETPQQ